MAFQRAQSPFSTPTIVVGGPDLDTTNGGAVFTSTVIDNSATVSIGDVLAITTDSAGNGTGKVVRRYNAAGDKILGICVGFGQANGQAVDFDSGSTTTVTVTATNETGAMIYAKVDITPFAVWSAPLVSGNIHDTTAFGYGSWVENGTGANAGALTETSISATVSAHLGWACIGPDPEAPTTRGLVMCVEGLFRGQQTAS
jgi:hypothetical protein